MKFIHAADIHLDSPLVGLANYSDAPAERLRTATRDAFTNLMSEGQRCSSPPRPAPMSKESGTC